MYLLDTTQIPYIPPVFEEVRAGDIKINKMEELSYEEFGIFTSLTCCFC